MTRLLLDVFFVLRVFVSLQSFELDNVSTDISAVEE